MSLVIELSAVVVTIRDHQAFVLCLPYDGLRQDGPQLALPSGPFLPHNHRTFDLALRAFVTEQTGFTIGYVEQLYTFGDDGRYAPVITEGHAVADQQAERIISLGYLALTPDKAFHTRLKTEWVAFSELFPWEDWRDGEPACFKQLKPVLDQWVKAVADPEQAVRQMRVQTLFPEDFDHWNEERVLDRYELLYDAGLIPEAHRHQGKSPDPRTGGHEMMSDHRRIIATGLSRLRGKIKYRPVIFELMPERFTLLELQRALEAITGLNLHKQNFRRALDRTGFVTPLGVYKDDTGGRPAELYSYNRDQFRFSPSQGLSLPTLR